MCRLSRIQSYVVLKKRGNDELDDRQRFETVESGCGPRRFQRLSEYAEQVSLVGCSWEGARARARERKKKLSNS